MPHTQALNLPPRTVYQAAFVELHQSFPSQIQAISPSVDQVMRFMRNFRQADGTESEIETALREAVANAVVHGNGENSSKYVHVDCRCYMDGEVSVTVRDEGQGFETTAVPDPTTSDNRLLPHGRGIYLMQSLMDEVSFEENGNVVHMRKESLVHRQPHCRHLNQTDTLKEQVDAEKGKYAYDATRETEASNRLDRSATVEEHTLSQYANSTSRPFLVSLIQWLRQF